MLSVDTAHELARIAAYQRERREESLTRGTVARHPVAPRERLAALLGLAVRVAPAAPAKPAA